MLINAIACIDDGNAQGGAHRIHRMRVAIPQHDTIPVIVEHMRDILQGFALGDACGAAISDVDRITSQTMPSTIEGQTCPRAWFVKSVDQDLPG